MGLLKTGLLGTGLLLALLTSCVPLQPPPGRTTALNLDGPPPDVVILSVAGRCGPPCVAPRDNWDYLTARGTVDALTDSLNRLGLSVQAAGYASTAAVTFQSQKVNGTQRGFGALLQDFAQLRSGWWQRPRPPRLILLGHSQGAAWLHYLTRLYPEVRVDVQIDLDGLCAGWWPDHTAPLPDRWPADLPGPMEACDRLAVPGAPLLSGGLHSAKDIVWPNVALNLEVQSKRLPATTSRSGGLLVNYLFDPTPNVRLDGSSTGIETFVSAREDHSAVSYPNSDALAWVMGRLQGVAAGWKGTGSPEP